MNKYKRILLKLSGEALGGGQGAGLDFDKLSSIASEINTVAELGVETAVVLGAGNFIRGGLLEKAGFNREISDHMGMIATVINALAMQDRLESFGTPTRVCSAFAVGSMVEPYVRRRVIKHLERGRVVILAGGTGNPHFTTDTAAALRAAELGAEALLKATKVDGVFSADPALYPDAVKHETLTYMEVLTRRLAVMDSTAITLCMEKRIPIVVFDLTRSGNIERAALGEKLGTLVSA